ncbi:unnamed protein product [Rotaria sp. Silwood1]|nr:unnamed protein product [Rotaria sp. Silwood1]
MVEEALSNFGLFIDDENKIRLIDPERLTDSAELRDECKDFVDNVLEFKKIVDTLIEKTEEYSKQVEAARLKAIGAKNMLKSSTKYREFEKQQLQSLIKEKMIELDRLRVEYESLQKTEREQSEKMEQLSLKSLLFLLCTQIVQCQNLGANSINTNNGICSCNLNNGSCDVPCCCDTDCSAEDIKTFNCNDLIKNKDINSISLKSSAQLTCFKNIPIYKSNSPYIIEKQGDLVCVGDERNIDTNAADYQQQINQKLDSSVFSRSINIDNSVSSPLGTPIELTDYQAGISIFRYISTTNITSYYSLPIKLFNSQICSGLQPITYMNDFDSTCAQPVNDQTCVGALSATKYIGSFCLLTNPATLASNNRSYICCSGIATSTSWADPTCSNALQSLTMKIFYINPIGITNCSIILNTTDANSGNTVQQTFTIRFIQNGSTPSTTSRSGNPGYIQGAPIIAGILNGSSVDVSDFTILQASANRYCSNNNRITVRFGENVQSSCLFSSTASEICPNQTNLPNIFMPFNSFNLFVAANGNPNSSNISNWLPVTYCIFEIGSSNEPVCQQGSIPNSSTDQCYIRLDIQIAYANIGAVTNPQPILGAVVFHYQSVTKTYTSTLATPLLISQSVTFQDISNAPVAQGDRLPRPNVRLPGDFFYPFTLNRARSSISFSSFFNLFIVFIFTLM